MSTAIEWPEETWNPLAGCSMCSPGCANCYAETMAKRLAAMARADIDAGRNPGRKYHYLDVINDKGRWNGTIALIEESLTEPLRRRTPTTWFVNSMSDLFHEGVPFAFVDRVFAVMAVTPHHTYQILTKRPERMAEYLTDPKVVSRICDQIDDEWRDGRRGEPIISWPIRNVWLGASVEDQKRADERIPHLLRCPAAVLFLSCEPLLEAVWLAIGDTQADAIRRRLRGESYERAFLQWVIVGGESGPGARPFNIEWARGIVRQCKAAGVPVFVKQLGSRALMPGVEFAAAVPTGIECEHGQKVCGTCDAGLVRMFLDDRKGGDPAEWPEDLRVREMPEVRRG